MPEWANRRWVRAVAAALGGIVVGLIVLLAMAQFRGNEPAAANTTGAGTTAAVTLPPPPTQPGTSSPSVPTTTATTVVADPATTTVAETTTSSGASDTTGSGFGGDTDQKGGDIWTFGSVAGRVVDVRTGLHNGYTRVVFEFADAGNSRQTYFSVLYSGPAVNQNGSSVAIDGDTVLTVVLFPAETCERVPPAVGELPPPCVPIGPLYQQAVAGSTVTEILLYFNDATQLRWGIGLNGGEHPFTVDVLINPDRLVIDIGD